MQRLLFAASLLAAVLIAHGAAAAGDAAEADFAAAKGAVKALAEALKAELGRAMQSGGPVAAIEVCNTQAIPITRQLAAEHGLELGRVSLRNRNPANAPNAWQRAVLKDFERRHEAGEGFGSLAWSETVEVDGQREFRFMKAIPTGGLCLACHGTDLSPDISQVLARTYPDDLATGFSEGDIRGAFVVTRRSSR